MSSFLSLPIPAIRLEGIGFVQEAWSPGMMIRVVERCQIERRLGVAAACREKLQELRIRRASIRLELPSPLIRF